jgi:pimeloyl-ACP methyl ester carboxylesterase
VREPADRWLERDGISLHHLEWAADPEPGADLPPILLLHGLSSNAHYWDRVAQRLTGRRLIALDQRGHGLTGRPPRAPRVPEGLAMEQLVADAQFVIERVGLERPVIVGHSWGATVSLEVAAHLGDAASGLVFIDGPVQSAANLFSWEDAQRYMQPPLPRYSSFAQAIADGRRDFDGAWAEDLEPFVMSKLMQDGSAFVLTLTETVRLELLRGLYESPVDQLWAMLAIPAAALLARQGPAAMAARREGGARMLADIAPGVEVKWFDTPHDIPLYKPDEIAAEIARLGESEPAAAQQLQE